MSTFNRWIPVGNYSLAWRLFQQHHTHFNRIFWCDQSARQCVYTFTRGKDKKELASKTFPHPEKDGMIFETLEDWSGHYNAFDRWTRIAAVAALTGYLETFISQIAYAALESCPAILVGGGREIEGVAQLKRNTAPVFESAISPLVRGEWQTRCSAYSKLFGPCKFVKHVSILEEMRSLRNDASHSFGRPIASMRMAEKFLIKRVDKISNDRIKRFLATVEDVAKIIESDLAEPFIGCYESIRIYHHWPEKENYTGESPKTISAEFNKYHLEYTSYTFSKTFGVKLMEYYDKL